MTNYHPLAALIAGVKVKPLEWELRANKEGVVYCAYDPLYGREVEAPNERTCDAIDQDRTARILAALEAAPHVNETPKTEHDGADVLTNAAQARAAPTGSPRRTGGQGMSDDDLIRRGDVLRTIETFSHDKQMMRDTIRALPATDAREAALREAAAAVRARYMGDNNREDMEVLRSEAALAAIREGRG